MSRGPQCLGLECPIWLGPECPGPQYSGPESPSTVKVPLLFQQEDVPWRQRERRGPRTILRQGRNSSRCRGRDEISILTNLGQPGGLKKN